MQVLKDVNGSELLFKWPGGPGPRDPKVEMWIIDPVHGTPAKFTLDAHACDQIRQELQRVMEAPHREKRFEG